MGLQIRKGSKWWYGRWNANGNSHCRNLGIKIAGTPPPSLKDQGDRAFERSRVLADIKLQELREESLKKGHAEELVQELHKIRTGDRISSLPLTELVDAWLKIPRKRPPSKRYREHANCILTSFLQFLATHHPTVTEMAEVTPKMAKAFMAAQDARGISEKTWNTTLVMLRSTFRHLKSEAGMTENPFEDIPTKEEHTLNRKPFTSEELRLIVDAARDDDFVRPLIITGMCTAMRLGDCCTLARDNVDMSDRFIRVKTSKTGETVEIPIFPMLYEELLRHEPGESEYMFPAQAQMYLNNSSGVSYRARRVFAAAGFRDADTPAPLIHLTDDEVNAIRCNVLATLASLPSTAKRQRMRQAFELYMDGTSLPQVPQATGFSRSSVSVYLNELEQLTGQSFIRPRLRDDSPRRGDTTTHRKNGLRRASIRDFHSFRVTWITLALTAGVPMEVVRRVTGHRTVDVVLKHYFQPDREAFRQTLQSAMPHLLTSGEAPAEPRSVLTQVRQLLEDMDASTWEQRRAQALRLLDGEA